MSFQVGAGVNTFIPTDEATSGLIIGFHKNRNKFRVNRYGQIMKVSAPAGQFLRWKSEQEARLLSSAGQQHVWKPGADRPVGNTNLEAFEYEPYKTVRYNYGTYLDQQTVDNASFALLPNHVEMLGTQAMNERTQLALNALTGATWGKNVAYVDGSDGAYSGNNPILPSGQNWGNGDVTSPNIMKTLYSCAAQITRATNGTVSPEDLCVLINPNTAWRMGSTAEVQNMLARSPFAMAALTGSGEANGAGWGMPIRFHEFNVIVEDAVRVTSGQFATTRVDTFQIADGDAYIVSRPGGLETMEGSPVFSTLIGFFYEEFTSQAMADPWNRKIQVGVSTQLQYQVPAPQSGYYLKNVFSD